MMFGVPPKGPVQIWQTVLKLVGGVALFTLAIYGSLTNMPIDMEHARSLLVPWLADRVLGRGAMWLLLSPPFLFVIYAGLRDINWIVIARGRRHWPSPGPERPGQRTVVSRGRPASNMLAALI
jgi:hypothetical protein